MAITTTSSSNNQFICYSGGFLPGFIEIKLYIITKSLILLHFLEPKNCKKFRDCTNPSRPILQQCPSGTKYNASTSTCDASAECIEIECTASSELFSLYAPNSPYYIWCDLNPTTKEIIQNVMQCQKTWTFDLAKGQCGPPNIIAPTTTTSTVATTTTTSPADVYVCGYIGLLPGNLAVQLKLESNYLFFLIFPRINKLQHIQRLYRYE
jgi:hypothetical protein